MICLLELNYNKIGTIKALTKNKIKITFFIKLLLISSIPFAIITAIGNSKTSNSVPFLVGVNTTTATAIARFNIKSVQLFLKELFIDNAFGDFKNIAIIERNKMTPETQLNTFSELKGMLLNELK